MCPVVDIVLATLVVLVLLIGVVVVLVNAPWYVLLGIVGLVFTLAGMAQSKWASGPAPEEAG